LVKKKFGEGTAPAPNKGAKFRGRISAKKTQLGGRTPTKGEAFKEGKKGKIS